ncbi:MAG: DUF885 domain-containing protein [Novosphingobium sp.]
MVSHPAMGMIRRAASLAAAILLALPSLAQGDAPRAVVEAPGAEDARLMLLLRNQAAAGAELDPLDRLARGDEVAPEALAALFTDALDRRRLAEGRQALAALARIDRRKLSPERQLSYDSYAWTRRGEVAALAPDQRALIAVRPLNHFGGLHVEFPALIALGGSARYADEADYRRNLALIRVFPAVLDTAIVRMREGMAGGVVETRLTTANMIAQIDALLAQDATNSPFTSAVRDFPEAVPAAARPELRAAYRTALEAEVKPAYRRLRAFLAEQYLPAARDRVGLSEMKGGAGLYRRLVERQTTLPLDPAAVHKLGLSEVARIQREMEGVKREMGFAGALPQFFDHIRSDPKFHPATRDELAHGFAAVGRKVDALVPRYFARAPRTPLLIEPYPAYREKFEAGGSYNQGSPDGSRPGVFFYNGYDLPSRFLTGIATLYLHEGAPGHHFQISLAQENVALPDFQRFGGNNAYVEGWALYAETLGYEMGFYTDPMQHWGTLDDEMLRAMRLVVDTGLHTKGWSRDQAIDYMLANSGMGRSDATAEVERYIANPAQALSYKIGALTIQRLRKKAESALGPKFDIRAFHEQVLGSGALPLPVLEAKIDRWIAGAPR